MKRPILVLLAAAILNIGVVGSTPARAAAPGVTASTVTPAHHHGHRHRGDHDGGYDSHRHHPRDRDGDGDGYDGRDGHHRCAGLVVVCLL